MRVVIDGFNLSLEKGTGITTYARNLTYCVHELGHKVSVLYGVRRSPDMTPLMKEIAFFDENVGTSPRWIQQLRKIIDTISNPFSRRAYEIPLNGVVIHRQFSARMPYYDKLLNAPHLYDHCQIYFKLFRLRLPVAIPGGATIMHWTYPLPIKARGMKNIYTFHDLIPLRLPFTTLDKKIDYFKLARRLARHADHIITVSETSKNDIINILGVPETKVTNTYQSVTIPEQYTNITINILKQELLGAFRLEYKNYILFYGSIEPKKNIGRIIEAYLASGTEIPLVIVGAQAWKSEHELKLLIDDNIRSLIQIGPETLVKRRVIRLDYVTFPQLVNLIRGALVVTFPSLYEGFGLPILESMLCETPVITSNIGSTLEIAGDAAILVDPYNTREIKNAMLAAIGNPHLRDEKIEKGRSVAQRFSPAAYQKRVSEVYDQVAARK